MSNNGKIKINLDSLKSRREWKRHKVKDGHNVYRILPPFGEASNGYPYRKWSVIWGLFDPESGRARPFASSLTSEKKCPVFEYVQNLKKRAEQLKGQMQAAGESEEAIKERLTALNKLISDLNPKNVYVYNAADQAGEVGLLELKATAHKAMKTEMSQYVTDYNQDPTSLNSDDNDSGVWFDVIRTGQGRDTEYDVKKMQNKVKKATGGFSFEDDRSPLPDSVVENYENLAYDLTAIYQVKTYEELQEILEANMASIVEACPDADLYATLAFEKNVLGQTTAKSTPARTNSPTGTGTTVAKKPAATVTTRFDDADDEGDEVTTPAPVRNGNGAAKVSAKANLNLDDDFLAEADALLNS
jgi:hypothetical protein